MRPLTNSCYSFLKIWKIWSTVQGRCCPFVYLERFLLCWESGQDMCGGGLNFFLCADIQFLQTPQVKRVSSQCMILAPSSTVRQMLEFLSGSSPLYRSCLCFRQHYVASICHAIFWNLVLWYSLFFSDLLWLIGVLIILRSMPFVYCWVYLIKQDFNKI